MSANRVQAPPPLPHQRQEASAEIIANVDAHARAVERRWGTGKLPRLVPIDWMERFRSQRRKFETACFEFDHDNIRLHGEAMLRAFDKLESVATEHGHAPQPVEQWEFALKDGSLVVLVRDRAEMGNVDLGGRQAQVWALDEIADIIEQYPLLSRAKDAFPGAELIALRPNPAAKDALDDSLADVPW